MTAGELRAALADLPDDYEIVTHGGDGEITEIHVDRQIAASGSHCGLLVLVQGQTLTEEYNYDDRSGGGAESRLGH